MAQGFGLSKIGQIAVNVHDLARAVKFYRDVLGMRYLFEAPPKMAFFDCGGLRLMLGEAERSEFDHPASIIYYDVADIKDTAEVLKSRGVTFESDPHLVADLGTRELWLAFFKDTESNMLALMSEVPKAAKV
jgi:methylmalonyl-CoA/ethylmalonyl-CoA epimerase